MKTQHTPGPWAIAYMSQSDYTHLYITHDSQTRSQIIADLHCPVSINSEGETYSNENKQANARLIAAAPELLEALEACERYIHATMSDDNLAGIHEADFARAAIAKAKGE